MFLICCSFSSGSPKRAIFIFMKIVQRVSLLFSAGTYLFVGLCFIHIQPAAHFASAVRVIATIVLLAGGRWPSVVAVYTRKYGGNCQYIYSARTTQ